MEVVIGIVVFFVTITACIVGALWAYGYLATKYPDALGRNSRRY